MKRSLLFIVIPLLLAATAIIAVSCSPKQDSSILHYTCPMHPEIKSDKPGSCPICNMDLVPVKKENTPPATSTHDGHDHQSTASSTKPETVLTEEQSRLIGIQTAEVTTQAIIKDLVTQGRLAFNPKWWQAETELVEAVQLGDAWLIAAAESRLKLMGAGTEWIAEIKKSGKAHSSFIGNGDKNHPLFEATIYSGERESVARGKRASILSQEGSPIMEGSILSVGSITDPDSRTIAVLIAGESPLSDEISTNQFVQIAIHQNLGERLAIANDAILFNGDHVMVYVERTENRFEPVTVGIGAQGTSYSEVISGLSKGDRVVVNGNFLLDSETRLKGNMGTTHQH